MIDFYAWLTGCLFLSAIFYIIFVREDSFDRHDEAPACYGSAPGPQEQAENACQSCTWRLPCIIHNAGAEIPHILFYKPPCGKWYVHSHKLYPSEETAYAGARKFLTPETPIAAIPVSLNYLNSVQRESPRTSLNKVSVCNRCGTDWYSGDGRCHLCRIGYEVTK